LPDNAQIIATASDRRELPASQTWSVGVVRVTGVTFDA
jgi:hypothetical protein